MGPATWCSSVLVLLQKHCEGLRKELPSCDGASRSIETEMDVSTECQAVNSGLDVTAAPQKAPELLTPVPPTATVQSVPEPSPEPSVPPATAQVVSQDPAASTSQEDSSWACPACTLLNSNLHDACEVCGHTRPSLPVKEPMTTVTTQPVEPQVLQQSKESQQNCTGVQQPLLQEEHLQEPQTSKLVEQSPAPHLEEGEDALAMPSRQVTAMSGRAGPQQPQSRPGSAARSCTSEAPKSRQVSGMEDGCCVPASRQTSHCHAGKNSVAPSRQASHCNAGEGSVLPSRQASLYNAGEGSVVPSRQTSQHHAGQGSVISQEDGMNAHEIVPLRQEKVPLPTSETLGFTTPRMMNGVVPVDGGLRALADYQYETNTLVYHHGRTQDMSQKQVSRANSWSDDPFHGWRKEETLTAVPRSFSNLEGDEAKMLQDQVLWQHDPFHGWNHGLESGQPTEAIEKMHKLHQARKHKQLPSFNNVEVKRFQINKEYARPDPKDRQPEIRRHWSGVDRRPVLNAQRAWQRDAFFGWLPGRGFPEELPVISEDSLSRQLTAQHSATAVGQSDGVQQFPMKLSVQVIAAHNLVNADTGIFGDVSDPYVKFWLGSGSEQDSQKTTTINNDLNPVWNAGPFNFKLEQEEEVLHFEVYDEDTLTSDDFLGRLAIPLRDIVHGEPNVAVRIKQQLQDITHGELEVEITVSPMQLLGQVSSATDRQVSSANVPNRQISSANVPNRQVSTVSQKSGFGGGVQDNLGKLSLRVIAAHNLVNMDTGIFGDVSDPYVKFWLGSGSEQDSQKTCTIDNNLNPVWNSSPFNFTVPHEDDVLHLEVYDEDTFTSDDLLGRLTIPLIDIVHGESNVAVHIKEQLKDTKHGELEVEITFSPTKQTVPDALRQISSANVPNRQVSIVSQKSGFGGGSESVPGAIRQVSSANVPNRQVSIVSQKSVFGGGSESVPCAVRQVSSANVPNRQLSVVSQKSGVGGGPQFFPGVLSLRVIAAHNLVNMDTGILGDVSDPYVKFWLGSGSEQNSQKTPTINNDLNPRWNAGPFNFTVNSDDDVLHLEVYDEDTFTSDDLLGRLTIPVFNIVHGQPNVAIWIKDQLMDTDHGELEVELTYCPEVFMGA